MIRESLGLPPVVGTKYTSVFPATVAVNAIWAPSGKVRLDFEALSRRDATRLTAGARHKPEVAGVFKGDGRG